MKRDLRRSSFAYSTAVAAVLAVAGIRAALQPVLGDSAPLILFVIPVAAVAAFGGFGPGMLATVSGAAIGVAAFAPKATPQHPGYTVTDMLARIIPFLIVGATVSLMAALLEKARRRATAIGHALSASERRQRQIFDSATEFSIFTTDLDGVIDGWNSGAERIFGYPAATAVGMPAASLFTPEDRATDRPGFELTTARDQGRAADERWHVRADGSRFFASGVVMPLRDAAGAVTGFTKIARDMTDKQQIRDALDEARRRNRSALIAGDVGVYEWDVAADHLHGDENFGRIFDIPQTADGRSTMADYVAKIAPDDIDRVNAAVRHSVATGGDFEQEYRVLTGRTERWVLGRGRMEKDAAGRVFRFSGVVIDVTEKHRTASHSLQQEERYRTLFNSVDEGFCIVEMIFDAAGRAVDWRFLEVNPTFERQTGVKDATGKKMRDIAPDHEDSWFEIYGRVAATGEPVRFSNEAKALGRWFELYACRVDGPESHQVAVIFTDITARVTADRERDALLQREQTLRADAELSSRLKDDFLATISHELRTPLTSIVGWTHLLRDDGAPDAAMLAEGLDVIGRNAEAQSKLIEDILDVSRITSGKLRLNVQQLDLRETLRAAIATVATTAAAKGITLTADPGDAGLGDAGPAAVARVAGDGDRLQQVFWNLLVNAIKFTDRGGTVRVSLRADHSRWTVEVADTGRGIGGDFLPYVFERFRQADMSSTRHHGGLGLGLSIVRHLAEAHGGTVSASSPGPGGGSTFRVTLPVAGVHQEAEGEHPVTVAGRAATDECSPALDGAKVLVVDDEPDARRMIQATLARCGAHVTMASSVAEALGLLGDDHGFDAVLSDVGMPGEDGHSFARRLRTAERERGGRPLPAAALTAYTQPADRVAALDAGFDAYLSKPVRPADLIRATARLVETARSGRADALAGEALQ